VLDEGDTVALPPVIVYVLAPAGIIVNTWPAQILALFTLTVGKGFTVTELLLDAGTLHPVSVPLTVKTVFVAGVTTMLDVVAPLLQE
jgi:hypothetical protein